MAMTQLFGFFHKSIWHRSLAQLLNPLLCWLRIGGENRNRKSLTPRIRYTESRRLLVLEYSTATGLQLNTEANTLFFTGQMEEKRIKVDPFLFNSFFLSQNETDFSIF